MSDEEINKLLSLIKKDKKKSGKAFKKIFDAYSKKLHGFALSLCDNNLDAEDLCQDVWVIFYDKVKNSNDKISLPKYLYLKARNLFVEKMRLKNNSHLSFKENDFLKDIPEPSDLIKEFEREDLIKIIKISLATLSDESSSIMSLRWFSHKTYKEIAEEKNDTEANIRKKINRILIKLIGIMKPVITEVNGKKGE